MRLATGSSDLSFKDDDFDVSQSYYNENWICRSFELTNFLEAAYHHQGS